MVALGLGPKLLITTTLLIVIFLTRDLKSKIVIDGDTFYYEALIRKRSYPIKDIAQIVKRREKANGIGGRADYFYVRDKHLNDIFILPESLPQKTELEQFNNIIKTINPDCYTDLFHKEYKVY